MLQRARSGIQFLYPEMIFSCNGSVTKWTFGAKYNGDEVHPELQIWRQCGSDDYTKIGSSSVNANAMIDTNLYEFIPQTPLEFKERDIFGIFIPVGLVSRGLVLNEQKGSGPTNIRIEKLTSPPSTLHSSSFSFANNDFPLVTVEISNLTYHCIILT